MQFAWEVAPPPPPVAAGNRTAPLLPCLAVSPIARKLVLQRNTNARTPLGSPAEGTRIAQGITAQARARARAKAKTRARAGQGRAGQGRAGQGRAGQGDSAWLARQAFLHDLLATLGMNQGTHHDGLGRTSHPRELHLEQPSPQLNRQGLVEGIECHCKSAGSPR